MTLTDSRAVAQDAVEDFFGFSLDAIHHLQNEVRGLRAENERLGRELAWAEAQYEEILRELREAL